MRSPPTKFASNIALLTGPAAYTIREIASAVRSASGQDLEIERIGTKAEYVRKMVEYDQESGRGGKGSVFFEKWWTFFEGLAEGEGATVDGLMEELLGRKPRDGLEIVKALVIGGGEDGRGYTWHQNYASGSPVD